MGDNVQQAGHYCERNPDRVLQDYRIAHYRKVLELQENTVSMNIFYRKDLDRHCMDTALF